MGKYSSHNSYYYEKKEVPSVTTVLKILAKPALVKWANMMGFKRKWVDNLLEESSDIGTNVHLMVECFLKQKYFIWFDTKYTSKNILKAYLNQFLNWYKKHTVEVILMEESLSCELFGGTVDFYGIIDGKKTVMDFKTSKSIYSSQFLQISAYVYMLEQQGYEVDQVAVLAINSGKVTYKTMDRSNMDKYINTFLSLAKTFELWYSVNEEDKWGDILGK